VAAIFAARAPVVSEERLRIRVFVQATNAIWINPQDSSKNASQLQQLRDIAPPIVAQVLHARNMSPAHARAYLEPSRGAFHDAGRLQGMDIAVERVMRARAAREKVAIYGDSDVDGVTSVAVLAEALGYLGVDTLAYVPNRLEETIGVHVEPLLRFAEQGVSLVITADCSVTSEASVVQCAAVGLQVLVTDHHAPCPVVPGVLAVINPQRGDCTYPCRDLGGVGVAFKLAQRLLQTAGLPDERAKRLLDLVALGTIADMVPLVGENRALVWQGLAVLNDATRPGLRLLAAHTGLTMGSISSTDVGCRICPRLNAAGFLDGGSVAYALLTARAENEAAEAVTLIEQRFRDRQQLSRKVLSACIESIGHGSAAADRLVVAHIDPSEAPVAGFVAGKLVETYGSAALVLHQTGDMIRGTLRAAPPGSMVDALIANKDALDQFGGHVQAAGFTAPAAGIGALIEGLSDYIGRAYASRPSAPQLLIDAEVTPYEIDWELFEQLQSMEPFGAGNSKPLLLCRRLRVHDFRCVGGHHLQMTLRRGSLMLSAIAHGHGAIAEYLRRDLEVDVVFSLDTADWNGEHTLQLRVRDLVFNPA
jgi:single-stranded-DNA-specific exonuclease